MLKESASALNKYMKPLAGGTGGIISMREAGPTPGSMMKKAKDMHGINIVDIRNDSAKAAANLKPLTGGLSHILSAFGGGLASLLGGSPDDAAQALPSSAAAPAAPAPSGAAAEPPPQAAPDQPEPHRKVNDGSEAKGLSVGIPIEEYRRRQRAQQKLLERMMMNSALMRGGFSRNA